MRPHGVWRPRRRNVGLPERGARVARPEEKKPLYWREADLCAMFDSLQTVTSFGVGADSASVASSCFRVSSYQRTTGFGRQGPRGTSACSCRPRRSSQCRLALNCKNAPVLIELGT